MINIYIPTYKKKQPTILKLIDEDPDIKLIFCVRHEELISGFYNSFPKSKQIDFLDLGNEIRNIGDTRQRILDYCIKNNIQYCIMFDDTVLRLVSKNDESIKTSEILKQSIKSIENDSLKDYIAMFSYVKRYILRQVDDETRLIIKPEIPGDNETYFACFPAQAYILNTSVLNNYSIKYQDMNAFGLEDTVFVAECIKNGLIFKFDNNFKYDGEETNTPKSGGNHTEANDFDKVKIKYDKMHFLTYEAYKDMMGVTMEARYRHYLHNQILFLAFDWSYYRNVLTKYRSDNQNIIDHHLSYKYYVETYIK